VGPGDVARYRIGMDTKVMVIGKLGVHLNPYYYLGGEWPEQTETMSAGQMQRLELRYEVFYKCVELYFEHYENIFTRGEELSHDRWLYNLIGIRIKIIGD
jgi:hypothetical protein